MKITIIGTGYVGLVTGTCFAELGFKVTCVDQDIEKIVQLQQGEIPIYEPGLKSLINTNCKKGNLSFSTNTAKYIQQSDIIFIAVGTPTDLSTGEVNLRYIFMVAEEIAQNLKGYTLVINKSTVPIGTATKITQTIKLNNPTAQFEVVSNPEFLREGSAIDDFMNPDRIVVGHDSQKTKEILTQLYRPLSTKSIPIVFTNPNTAELIKYASNAFLATKISFINQMSDLCEKCDGDVQAISLGMGLDKRIGKEFLNPGPGYGGSCFPKDIQALSNISKSFGAQMSIVTEVMGYNNYRKKHLAKKIVNICGDIDGKKICILGLTFKANTDDMRDSPSIDIIKELQTFNANIIAYDPQGMNNAKKILNINYAKDAYEAAQNACAIVILTEWNEFHDLDFTLLASKVKNKIVVDMRNIYINNEIMQNEFAYFPLGKKTV